jgi:uncharacterized protein YkwD
MANKEELTTAMHAEFMEGEISAKDMKIMGVYGAIGAGSSKSDALKKYGISEKEYNENIKRVLKS